MEQETLVPTLMAVTTARVELGTILQSTGDPALVRVMRSHDMYDSVHVQQLRKYFWNKSNFLSNLPAVQRSFRLFLCFNEGRDRSRRALY